MTVATVASLAVGAVLCAGVAGEIPVCLGRLLSGVAVCIAMAAGAS
ncbi:hypothetical protein ACWEQ1_19090 [Streptomyces nodosus]